LGEEEEESDVVNELNDAHNTTISSPITTPLLVVTANAITQSPLSSSSSLAESRNSDDNAGSHTTDERSNASTTSTATTTVASTDITTVTPTESSTVPPG
ncbi:unnamed protein product, partial [Gongylonema pulchrum]|uniref:Listeriolysin O n=1 Tax=Gongylonema pulchrum TaxID=637853 RepID=A0A183EQI5_9BILA